MCMPVCVCMSIPPLQCCALLGALSTTTSAQTELLAHLDALLPLLTDPRVQVDVVSTLGRLFDADPAAFIVAVRGGGRPASLVNATRVLVPLSLPAVSTLCSCIAAVAEVAPTAFAPLTPATVGTVLFSAAAAFPNSAPIARAAIRTMAALVGKRVDAADAAGLVNAGALAQLEACVSLCGEGDETTVLACVSLTVLALGSMKHARPAFVLSALSTLLACVAVPPHWPSVCAAACAHLLLALPAAGAALPHSRAVSVLLAALRANQDDAATLTAICDVFVTLFCNASASKAEFVIGGGLSVLLPAFTKHAPLQETARSMCQVVAVLSLGAPELESELVFQGFPALVLGALAPHAASKPTVTAALTALINMSYSPSVKPDVVTSERWALVVGSLSQMHTEDDDVICAALSLLTNIVREETLQALTSPPVVVQDTVLRVLKRSSVSTSVTVLTLALKLLIALCAVPAVRTVAVFQALSSVLRWQQPQSAVAPLALQCLPVVCESLRPPPSIADIKAVSVAVAHCSPLHPALGAEATSALVDLTAAAFTCDMIPISSLPSLVTTCIASPTALRSVFAKVAQSLEAPPGGVHPALTHTCAAAVLSVWEAHEASSTIITLCTGVLRPVVTALQSAELKRLLALIHRSPGTAGLTPELAGVMCGFLFELSSSLGGLAAISASRAVALPYQALTKFVTSGGVTCVCLCAASPCCCAHRHRRGARAAGRLCGWGCATMCLCVRLCVAGWLCD